MASPRIRDFFTFLTTLPTAVIIAVCLFLPHTEDCHHQEATAWDSGLWLVVGPIVLLGVLPFVWAISKRARQGLPEIVLMFTIVVMATCVLTLPLAIYLMYGYSKRQFRGEVLVAMCSASLGMIFLFIYPFVTLFDHWLEGAVVTWGAALIETIGFMIWTSAAVARGTDGPPELRLHVSRVSA